LSIKGAIARANTTQAKIARDMNVDPSAVNGWVTGRFMPTANRLSELANKLGCTVDELLREEKEEEKLNAQ